MINFEDLFKSMEFDLILMNRIHIKKKKRFDKWSYQRFQIMEKNVKKSRKKLNEFITEYDGFTSIKSISKEEVDDHKKNATNKPIKYWDVIE